MFFEDSEFSALPDWISALARAMSVAQDKLIFLDADGTLFTSKVITLDEYNQLIERHSMQVVEDLGIVLADKYAIVQIVPTFDPTFFSLLEQSGFAVVGICTANIYERQDFGMGIKHVANALTKYYGFPDLPVLSTRQCLGTSKYELLHKFLETIYTCKPNAQAILIDDSLGEQVAFCQEACAAGAQDVNSRLHFLPTTNLPGTLLNIINSGEN